MAIKFLMGGRRGVEKRNLAELRALMGPEGRLREAKQRLTLGRLALARGDRDDAGYHALRGLEAVADEPLPEGELAVVVDVLRSLARQAGVRMEGGE